MGRYITHEGLPFYGTLEKIRIRSCRATDPSLPGFNEEQLLEITRDGEVKLTQKAPSGTEKNKIHISQADADSVFAAFSETFASYRKERIPSISGHWRVRLLTDDNEVCSPSQQRILPLVSLGYLRQLAACLETPSPPPECNYTFRLLSIRKRLMLFLQCYCSFFMLLFLSSIPQEGKW